MWISKEEYNNLKTKIYHLISENESLERRCKKLDEDIENQKKIVRSLILRADEAMDNIDRVVVASEKEIYSNVEEYKELSDSLKKDYFIIDSAETYD